MNVLIVCLSNDINPADGDLMSQEKEMCILYGVRECTSNYSLKTLSLILLLTNSKQLMTWGNRVFDEARSIQREMPYRSEN